MIKISGKEKVFITLEGCDDETVFPMDFTNEEVDLIKGISVKSKLESRYSCMPILNIFTGKEAIERIREYEEDKAEAEEDE